jgi:acyl-CoA reductase-like NAD-dependent aldehyde dehydrogenase
MSITSDPKSTTSRSDSSVAPEPIEIIDSFETFDPRTGSLIAEIEQMSAAQVGSAVDRARSTAVAWSSLTYKERTRHLLKVRDQLLNSAEELVDTICAETGKQRAEAVTTELMAVCETIGWYAKNGERALDTQSVSPGLMAHKKAWKRYEPLGVIAVISPWNYPFTLSMTPVITALFAGNTVVLKPSEVTPTVGLAIGKLFEDDSWGDIVQVVTGGGETGEALVRSGCDKICFTGSVRTGKRVMAAAADSLTPVLLELGGKDPMIVCVDADLARASKGAVWGAFQNSGQTCMSVERFYVEESIFEEFLERVLKETALIRQNASGGDIGSMTFAPQIEIVEEHIADALSKGARVVAGGHRLDQAGLWFEPTVLVDVDHTMSIMTEETFGPVMPIMSVSDPEEGLRLANDSIYGLNSSVWTSDQDLAISIANRLEAGNVCINDCIVSYAIPGLPFGGVKQSGIGRVHGPEGLREFSAIKSVMSTRVAAPRELWWFPVPQALEALGITSMRARFGSTLGTRMKRYRKSS